MITITDKGVVENLLILMSEMINGFRSHNGNWKDVREIIWDSDDLVSFLLKLPKNIIAQRRKLKKKIEK